MVLLANTWGSNMLVSFEMRYGEFEGVRSLFKVDGDEVKVQVLDNRWHDITECSDEFLVDVWFQCANLEVKRAIEALGLV